MKQCKTLINDNILPPFYLITDKQLVDIEFSVEDLKNIIHALNPNKSHGPDNISIRMLLICGDPIPTTKCAKLFERILFNNIYNYLISNNLITTNQSGFKPSDSTTNQLLHLTHIIHSSFDLNISREVRHVFLDMSKAFDKLWHEGLLFKLKQNGISGQILNLLISYSDKRKPRVLLNGCESHWAIVESGVPQGSVLGPLLFLIYINDLEKELNLKSIILLMTLLYFLQ